MDRATAIFLNDARSNEKSPRKPAGFRVDGSVPTLKRARFCFGRLDRALDPERPVIGKLRPMAAVNARRKMQLGSFIDR
jgi:hypothetical protein